MRILIVTEHLEREYLFALLLRRVLKDKKHDVLIANMFFDFFIIEKFQPEIVFLPYFYKYDDQTISRFLQINSVKNFISLSWEQLFNQMQIKSKMPVSPPLNLIFLAWSLEWSEALSKLGIKNQIEVIGHPMWSLYWKSSPIPKIGRYGKQNSKLYIENLTWSSFSTQNRMVVPIVSNPQNEIFISRLRRKFILNSKLILKTFFKEYVDEIEEKPKYWTTFLTKVEISSLVNYEKTFLQSINNMNRNSFSVKIRPSATRTRHAMMVKLFKGANVVRGKPILFYLRRANVCFSDFSSSAIDSVLLGVPTYSFSVNKIPDRLQFKWQRFFDPIVHMNGLVLNNLFKLNQEKLLRYLFESGFINDKYFDDLFAIIENLNVQSNNKNIKRLNSKLYQLYLWAWHALQSILIVRLLLIKIIPSKLDIRTHTQDFISFRKYMIYRKLTKLFVVERD